MDLGCAAALLENGASVEEVIDFHARGVDEPDAIDFLDFRDRGANEDEDDDD